MDFLLFIFYIQGNGTSLIYITIVVMPLLMMVETQEDQAFVTIAYSRVFHQLLFFNRVEI